MPETILVPEKVEVNPDVGEIEKGFIKVQDKEDKERKIYDYNREGDYSLNRVSPREKRIFAERGARARRKAQEI